MQARRALVVVATALVFLLLAWPAQAKIKLKPEQACKLLRNIEMKAGPYRPQGDLYVCEAELTLTGGKQPNTMNYQVLGDKDAVQELRLELSVDHPQRQDEANKVMAQAALRLAQKLGASEAPDGLEEAVRRCSEGSWVAGEAELVLVKHTLPDPPNGYKLVLTAR